MTSDASDAGHSAGHGGASHAHARQESGRGGVWTTWQPSPPRLGGLGLLLFLIGFFFLAKDFRWIDERISIWPVLLMGIGIYIALRPLLRRC